MWRVIAVRTERHDDPIRSGLRRTTDVRNRDRESLARRVARGDDRRPYMYTYGQIRGTAATRPCVSGREQRDATRPCVSGATRRDTAVPWRGGTRDDGGGCSRLHVSLAAGAVLSLAFDFNLRFLASLDSAAAFALRCTCRFRAASERSSCFRRFASSLFSKSRRSAPAASRCVSHASSSVLSRRIASDRLCSDGLSGGRGGFGGSFDRLDAVVAARLASTASRYSGCAQHACAVCARELQSPGSLTSLPSCVPTSLPLLPPSLLPPLEPPTLLSSHASPSLADASTNLPASLR